MEQILQEKSEQIKKLGSLETIAYKYVLKVLFKGRRWLSLTRMAKDLNLTYDQCETFMTIFHAQQIIPRMTIIEEAEE